MAASLRKPVSEEWKCTLRSLAGANVEKTQVIRKDINSGKLALVIRALCDRGGPGDICDRFFQLYKLHIPDDVDVRGAMRENFSCLCDKDIEEALMSVMACAFEDMVESGHSSGNSDGQALAHRVPTVRDDAQNDGCILATVAPELAAKLREDLQTAFLNSLRDRGKPLSYNDFLVHVKNFGNLQGKGSLAKYDSLQALSDWKTAMFKLFGPNFQQELKALGKKAPAVNSEGKARGLHEKSESLTSGVLKHLKRPAAFSPSPEDAKAFRGPALILKRPAASSSAFPCSSTSLGAHEDSEGLSQVEDNATASNDEDAYLAFQENVQALSSWLKMHGGQYPLRNREDDGKHAVEHSLAVWIKKQRAHYKEGVLGPLHVIELEKIVGWSWEPLASSWEKSYNELSRWIGEQPKYPSRYAKTEAERLLGEWVYNQVKMYNGKKWPLLSEDRVQKLLQVPRWSFPVPDMLWSTMFSLLKAWFRNHGTLPTLTSHVQTDERWLPIGKWLADQREGAKCTPRQRESLQAWLDTVT